MFPSSHLDPCSGDVSEEFGVTKVDAMFLAAWHSRADVVEVLLRHGASPFSVSKWCGFDTVIPLEVSLVYHFFHHGGLVNEYGAKADTPQTILAVNGAAEQWFVLSRHFQGGHVPSCQGSAHVPGLDSQATKRRAQH